MLTAGSMKALVLQDRLLSIEVVAEPFPSARQALVRSLACGVCGPDLHAVHHLPYIIEGSLASGAADTIDPCAPLVTGHEFRAEILVYGPETERRLRPGSHVDVRSLLTAQISLSEAPSIFDTLCQARDQVKVAVESWR